ncbi:RiPP maturation radical SAM C-methyltransferase [Bradyrhizobium sp. HKCCYLS3077]|uniref:RiPP maturation radical SAM C-methyltransferase n=1 Tax=Bradyrhizobium sp. HKCCYLS3077 TaxID=3420761 RepID=UPI003EBA4A58
MLCSARSPQKPIAPSRRTTSTASAARATSFFQAPSSYGCSIVICRGSCPPWRFSSTSSRPWARFIRFLRRRPTCLSESEIQVLRAIAMTISVALVAAPFLALTRPALGISTLQAALETRGVGARQYYLGFAFAELIGAETFQFIAEQVQTSLLIGEWVFAGTFDNQPDPIAEARHRQRMEVACGPHWADVVAARDAAETFVDQSARRLIADGARIIGFSSTFQQNCASLGIAHRIKQLAPDRIICFGGANCEGPMGEALLDRFSQIDYVFRGESDRTFPAFVERFLAGTLPYSESTDVLGRVGTTGRLVEPPLEDLDELPVPDFSDYFGELRTASFFRELLPALPFESSRGCWWGMKHHCTFCGLNGATMAFRTKSAERVLAELATLSVRWGIKRFEATDNILNLKHVDAVFGQLAKTAPSSYRILYEIKSNMRPEQLRTLARGGVTWVQPGIEHLDNDVLRLMDKGVTGLQNVRVLRSCAEIGLRPIWNVLCGFPGERPAAYAKIAGWLALLEHLQPPTGHCRIRLDRFSPYFDRAAELGFENVAPALAYRSVYGQPDDVLKRLAYFFDGTAANTASDEDLAPLGAAIKRWRAAHVDGTAMPMLAIVGLGPFSVLKDTRRIATETWRIIDPIEMAVLDAFREPVRIDTTLRRLVDPQTPAAEVEQRYADLVASGCILEDADCALTLVTSTDSLVIDDECRRDFPGGWLRPIAGSGSGASFNQIQF